MLNDLSLVVFRRLHYSLITFNTWDPGQKQRPKPLQGSYELRLLQLVKWFSILHTMRSGGPDFRAYDCPVLNIEQCFDHFAPTLDNSRSWQTRSFLPADPVSSIGHFPGPQNLELCEFNPAVENEISLSLIPSHTPPLCGRLTLNGLSGEET